MLKVVLAGAAGAGLMYFLDPRKGHQRLTAARGRIGSLFRPAGLDIRPAGRRDAVSGTEMMARRPIGAVVDRRSSRSDARLAARIEAELRGDPDVAPGQVTIRTENGRVILRGRVDHPEQIGAIVDRVRAIDGVGEVENRLHVFQSPARAD